MQRNPLAFVGLETQMTKVADVVAALEYLAPAHLAENWDRIGLAIGNPQATVTAIAFALDPTSDNIQAAAKAKAQVLVTHHPLFFGEFTSLSTDTPAGDAAVQAARRGISVICAHTNLDAAAHGTAAVMAEILGIEDVAPLQPAKGIGICKIVTFVPEDACDKVAEAMMSAGGGVIGEYESCSFRSAGIGAFLPKRSARPFVGHVGKLNFANEIRLEVPARWDLRDRIVKALLAAHPYGEPAYDVYPLDAPMSDIGAARIGRLPQPMSIDDLAAYIGRKLGTRYLMKIRPTGKNSKPIRQLIVSPGSGSFALDLMAPNSGCALFTGELNYHRALEARFNGIPVIAAGHFATEIPVVKALADSLTRELTQRGFKVQRRIIQGETDPFEVTSNGKH
jgi:dinuclear metal center YbgI/SA1388 family protein